jgi:GT2 family glycosyltransferase
MDLSIVIVNWNSSRYLQKCLHSVYKHTRGLKFEVIVIDAGSFDGCREMLHKDFPQVKFIQSEKNVGFARANNFAASQASGYVLVFLNPDTELHGPAVRIIYEATIAVPEAGTLGARLLNADGTLQTSCIQALPTVVNQFLDGDRFRKWFPHAALWGTAPLWATSLDPVAVEGVSGACLVTPRKVFEKVGGFSEDYFMYYEDMDYCRKTLSMGLRNYYVPRAELVHHGGRSSDGQKSMFSAVMMAESGWRYFRKHHGAVVAALFRCSLGVKASSRTCLLALTYVLVRSRTERKRIGSIFRKWVRVFRWASGGERWVADY